MVRMAIDSEEKIDGGREDQDNRQSLELRVKQRRQPNAMAS